ncbi:MAG: hypothetical protein HOE69_05580 [Euryarchaeota archaeon]|nr:hypothetical protein [Euryarchaeota archaeon]
MSADKVNAPNSERMKIAYVHDPPNQSEIATPWREPAFLAERGFTDLVVGDQLFGCLSLTMEGAPSSQISARLSQLDNRINAALDANLDAWVMEDLFTLKKEEGATIGCPHDDETWRQNQTNLSSFFSRFPDLKGIIFRFGESFDCDSWARRENPFSCQCELCHRLGKIGALQRIIKELEEAVCEHLGMYCIIRMWDLGEDGFHADSEQQSAALISWNDNTRLVVSVKHTATDYWRHQPWNDSIELDGPPRLIEFQCEREYEFLGLVPNWLGHSLAQGFSEIDEPEYAGLANSTPPNWAGSYIIPRGGGWSIDHAEDDFWSEMNAFAIIALTDNPQADPDEILDEFLQQSGFTDDGARFSLAVLIKMSSDLVLHLRYLPTFQDLSKQIWMPSHNWFRDDTFVPGACAHITNVVTKANMGDNLRAERAFTSIIARTQLVRAEGLFAGGQLSNHPKAGFILNSYRWAANFATLSEAIWNELLDTADLSPIPILREDAKQVILDNLQQNPLAPLTCLD